MYDMEQAMHGCESMSHGICEEASTGRMEEEVFNLCAEPQTKAQRVVEIYCRLRSVKATSRECELSESQVDKYLSRERDKRGLSDIRFLYTDSEEEFNNGNNAGDVVRQRDLMDLVERQQYRCALSGVELTPQSAALDHITPVADGGDHVINNLQWLNCEVNRMKGSLSVEAFVDICRRVVAVADAAAPCAPPPYQGTSTT